MENKELKSLVDKLEVNQSLAIEEYVALIDGYNSSIAQYAAEKAMQKKEKFNAGTACRIGRCNSAGDLEMGKWANYARYKSACADLKGTGNQS